MSDISSAIPLIIVAFVVVYAYLKDIKIFTVFTTGAKKGIDTAFSILPTLIGLLTAIALFTSSGLLEFTVKFFSPLCNLLNLPKEILPLAILRPISGSGSTASVINIFENYGPDSKIGEMASVLSSSTETTFYAVSVYFSATVYKKYLYTIPVALTGDLLAIFFTVLIVNFFS